MVHTSSKLNNNKPKYDILECTHHNLPTIRATATSCPLAPSPFNVFQSQADLNYIKLVQKKKNIKLIHIIFVVVVELIHILPNPSYLLLTIWSIEFYSSTAFLWVNSPPSSNASHEALCNYFISVYLLLFSSFQPATDLHAIQVKPQSYHSSPYLPFKALHASSTC